MKNLMKSSMALICLASLMSFGPILAKTTIDPDVAAIIMRTRETQATYALYVWNKITPVNVVPIAEWSAEFHAGDLHRVETPKVRIVANCRTMTGTYFDIETGGRYVDSSAAKMACGINANPNVVSVRRLGIKQTAFGEAISIEFIDQSQRRTYDVSKEGILLGAMINEKGRNGRVLLIGNATNVSRKLPEADIFSERSLDRSVVAERYRNPIDRNSKPN